MTATCRPEVTGVAGAVSSTHWLATQAGMDALRAGGNAFDAAVAAAFVLAVVEPHSNGPAGDVPILLHDGATGRVRIVCGQGPMPRAATIAHMRSLGLDHVPGSGLLPACVPGAFGAWLRLLAEWGTLRLADVLEPAIGYAGGGFPLLPQAARVIDALAELFRGEWPESARTYLVRGRAPAAGERVRNPELAATLRRVLDEAAASSNEREAQIEAARRAFYEGFVAEAVDAFATSTPVLDATGARHRGLLTGADMAAWRPTVEDPVALDYRGVRVHKPGPWSQGPVFLQQLALLDGFDLAAGGLGGTEYVHTLVECAKLALADREAWYGDPDHADVPMAALLSRGYAHSRRALVGRVASGDLVPGAPEGRDPLVPPTLEQPPGDVRPAWARQLLDGLPTVAVLAASTRGDTCCVTAADRDGNIVVATPSGGWLKSSPVVPGLGFPLGTRGQMATLAPGHPNALAPGKRPRTTLSPTLVTRDGAPSIAFGTPGGDQQDQWTLGFFLAHAEFGLGLQAATEALAFHTEHAPSSFAPRVARPRVLAVERDCDADVVAGLRSRGHEVTLAPPRSLGRVCATGFTAHGTVVGAASPRGAQTQAAAR